MFIQRLESMAGPEMLSMTSSMTNSFLMNSYSQYVAQKAVLSAASVNVVIPCCCWERIIAPVAPSPAPSASTSLSVLPTQTEENLSPDNLLDDLLNDVLDDVMETEPVQPVDSLAPAHDNINREHEGSGDSRALEDVDDILNEICEEMEIEIRSASSQSSASSSTSSSSSTFSQDASNADQQVPSSILRKRKR
jgi:hypothetical protein